ncbi:hypothetical protein GCM10022255_052480 [Dactylosporangium darangshiense]|uniref:Uncharacterized protein n=1 Tax=Dactylosporangium darangshiense TaxID=579108 RepID=A0ABP8DD30_9ACTN
MSTLEERLREEMARAVAPVRPEPDPYARLLRRRRRRGWRWGSTALAAAVVAAVLGAQALVAPSNPSPNPTPEPPPYFRESNDVALDHWGRDIIAASTRGNAAQADPALVEALRQALDRVRRSWAINPALDRIKVLYIVDVGGSRAYAAAYYNNERVQFVAAAAPAGSGADALVSTDHGMQTGALEPFTLGGDAGKYTIAMVPPGCLAAPSAATKVGPDSSLQQTWAQGAAFVVEDRPALQRWWKISCDGVVREVLVAGSLDGPHGPGTPPPAERGHADPEVVAQLLRYWPPLPGLDVRDRRIVWGGTVEGESRSVAVGVGELGDGSAVVVAATGKGDGYLVTSVKPDTDLEQGAMPSAQVTTAVSPRSDFVAVRLPAEDHRSLSDRLLVLAPPGAVELRAGSGPGAETKVTLADGVGVLHVPVPAKVIIRAVDAQGRTVAELTVSEPRNTTQILAGQGLMRNWD